LQDDSRKSQRSVIVVCKIEPRLGGFIFSGKAQFSVKQIIIFLVVTFGSAAVAF